MSELDVDVPIKLVGAVEGRGEIVLGVLLDDDWEDLRLVPTGLFRGLAAWNTVFFRLAFGAASDRGFTVSSLLALRSVEDDSVRCGGKFSAPGGSYFKRTTGASAKAARAVLEGFEVLVPSLRSAAEPCPIEGCGCVPSSVSSDEVSIFVFFNIDGGTTSGFPALGTREVSSWGVPASPVFVTFSSLFLSRMDKGRGCVRALGSCAAELRCRDVRGDCVGVVRRGPSSAIALKYAASWLPVRLYNMLSTPQTLQRKFASRRPESLGRMALLAVYTVERAISVNA